MQPYLPNHDETGEFHIPFPPSNEVYVFNRYGQHIFTKDLTSGKTRYSFLYSKNTSFGKLSTVTDSAGNKIQFLRDYSSVVSSIENTQDHKSELKISAVGFLEKLSERGRAEIALAYDGSTGLLTSRSGVSMYRKITIHGSNCNDAVLLPYSVCTIIVCTIVYTYIQDNTDVTKYCFVLLY